MKGGEFLAGDVLSQTEIDDLLSALSTGVVSVEEIKNEQKQKKIRAYDFKRPDKFSKRPNSHSLHVT